MKTKLTTSIEEAADFIRRGGIVAFPTETVYGLGASVFDEDAIGKIFAAKGRPSDNPLIVHVGAAVEIGAVAASIPAGAQRLIASFFPGPLTLVLKKSNAVPLAATAGLATVGVRVPAPQLAREFIAACGSPVVAPSANLSGRPSPTTWQAVIEDLDGRIDCVLTADDTEIGIESTVVDCTCDPLVVLRQGAVTIEQLRAILPDIEFYRADGAEAPRSPGMAHRHYAPGAGVIIIEGSAGLRGAEAAYIGIGQEPEPGRFAVVHTCSSVEEYAHVLFEFFRECDRSGVTTIYCQQVPEEGLGAAVMDRLRRAAQG